MVSVLDPSIYVSGASYESAEPDDILGSNFSFLDGLLLGHVRRDEVSPAALASYDVDRLLGEWNNGSLSGSTTPGGSLS